MHEVDEQTPVGSLRGTDNIVAIETMLFKKDQELVLRGPGAGVARTAATIVADLELCALEFPRHHIQGASHLH